MSKYREKEYEKGEVDLRTLHPTVTLAIKNLQEALDSKDQLRINLEVEELLGAINGSYHGGEISKETADWLRKKYLY